LVFQEILAISINKSYRIGANLGVILKKIRCEWVNDNPLLIDYHDKEWGVPVYDDRLLFELLTLEGMQAGLSWLTVLKKRQAYHEAFANFDAETIATFDKDSISSLMKTPNIIRHQLKIKAVINNADAFLKVQNHWQSTDLIPSKTEISETLSKDLKKQGFKFVGGTICYAFMQAAGLVNDHTTNCFCYD